MNEKILKESVKGSCFYPTLKNVYGVSVGYVAIKVTYIKEFASTEANYYNNYLKKVKSNLRKRQGVYSGEIENGYKIVITEEFNVYC